MTQCSPSSPSQINAFVQLEGEAMGTGYAANDSTRDAFATDIRGSEWMIFTMNSTGREMWDYVSVPLTPDSC